MPSTVTPRRRQRDETRDDEERSAYSEASTTSQSSKRTRLNDNGHVSPGQTPLLPNDYQSQPLGSTHATVSYDDISSMKHQPGSIVRVKLINFVTYTKVEFFPGPSLNMVIGPNGTGKSTLVCAICLGLGWGPQHLGRAKEVSEFVKHGSQEAMIEIELATDGRRHTRNPVIKCSIKREGNKIQFSINDKPSNKKNVMELARSFSIQIDNLCQFLPQDKVVEFAAMSPVELLRSTQRAVASQKMIDWHEELKDLREKQRIIENQNATDLDILANLEGRQRMQEADVERMREREQVKQRVKMLETSRPFAKYRQARNNFLEAKRLKTQGEAELNELKEAVEPALQAVNAKQMYLNRVKNVATKRKEGTEKFNKKVDTIAKKIDSLEERLQEIDKEKEAEKKSVQTQNADIKRLNGVITGLKKRIEEEPIEFDAAAYNERIREKARALQECQTQGEEIQRSNRETDQRGAEKNLFVSQAKKDIENLDSQAGQQNNKLLQIARQTSQAWNWIQQHQDEFEKRVCGPPIVECSIKDPRYVDLVEGLFTKSDLICFTVQTKSDFKKLRHQVYDIMRLTEVNIRTMTAGLQEFPSPASNEVMQRLGLDGFALDFLSGPEPVLAMLCAEGPRLHQSGVALRDISPEQYELIQNSPIATWVAGKSFYRINRRREYGPGATSTQVRDIRPAQVWTDQPVDMAAKQELQRKIENWEQEMVGLRKRLEENKVELEKVKEKRDVLEEQKNALQEDKKLKQAAAKNFAALPTRLASNQEKLAAAESAKAGVVVRFQKLDEKQDSLTLDKGKAALEYADAVEALRRAHDALFEAELMTIEATSDFETLSERNSAVKEELEAKSRAVEELDKAKEVAGNEAKKLIEICKKVQIEADDATQVFFSSMPKDQSVEELEIAIESERAALELMHEGNGGVIKEFEKRQREIDRLKARLIEVKEALTELESSIDTVRKKWEPRLDKLVQRISSSFSYNMKQINCAGEVSVHKDDNFEQWAIQIQVKFREAEPLTLLDSHRQSGGERAVSTIFYLMSLQSLTRSPFRVVDEINQGMDPRNERLVHARMVSIATGNDEEQFHYDAEANDDDEGEGEGGGGANGKDSEDDEGGRGQKRGGGSQYFLITPKLLHGLRYEPGMRVLCIASGEFMPKEQASLDFGKSVAVRRRLMAAAAG